RRHHHRHARSQESGHLVAERLAATGRHDHERIATCYDMVDHFGLMSAERLEPEGRSEEFQRRLRHGGVGPRYGRAAWEESAHITPGAQAESGCPPPATGTSCRLACCGETTIFRSDQ